MFNCLCTKFLKSKMLRFYIIIYSNDIVLIHSDSTIQPIVRTRSLKTSHELISPSSSGGAIGLPLAVHKGIPFDELDEDGSHSDDDNSDDDGSWI